MIDARVTDEDTLEFPPFRLDLAAEKLFHAVDDAAHIPHYERPEVVNPIVLEFLRRRL